MTICHRIPGATCVLAYFDPTVMIRKHQMVPLLGVKKEPGETEIIYQFLKVENSRVAVSTVTAVIITFTVLPEAIKSLPY